MYWMGQKLGTLRIHTLPDPSRFDGPNPIPTIGLVRVNPFQNGHTWMLRGIFFERCRGVFVVPWLSHAWSVDVPGNSVSPSFSMTRFFINFLEIGDFWNPSFLLEIYPENVGRSWFFGTKRFPRCWKFSREESSIPKIRKYPTHTHGPQCRGALP